MTGAQLQARRIRAKISLRGLAARMRISPSYLCDLEKGKRTGERAQAQIAKSVAELRAMAAKEREQCQDDRRRGELGGWNEYDNLRLERDAATRRAQDAEKQLAAIAVLVSIYDNQDEPEVSARRALTAIGETIGQPCSICRGRHGSEVRHAAE